MDLTKHGIVSALRKNSSIRELRAKAVFGRKTSARNAHLLFLTALVTVPALLFFLQFQGFLHGAA